MNAARIGLLSCIALAAACARRQTVLPDPRVRIDAPIEIELASSIPPKVVATVDGRRDLAFLVDTGASASSVDLGMAKALGFEVRPYAGKGRSTGSDGRSIEFEGYVSMQRLEIGSLVIEDLHVPAVDTEVTKIHGFFGILGQDVLGKMIFALDAERGRLHALPASTDDQQIAKYLKDAKLGEGAWAVAPVAFRPCPFLTFDVANLEGGEVELELDTGATDTSFPKKVIQALELQAVGTFEAHGIAGKHGGRTYRLDRLGLYGLEISTEIHESELDYGLFGMDILGELVVLFDAPHGKVWFHRRKEPVPEAGR